MEDFSAQMIALIGLVWLRYWSTSGIIAVLWVADVSSSRLDFEAQVQNVLKNEMLTRVEIANLSTVFHDLENTLQERWPGSEVFPLGSFVTGLASKSSDADCMVTVPHDHITTEGQLVTEAADLLTLYPQLYDQVTPKVHPKRRIALLKFIYTPTQRNCDVNFLSDIALHNTQMMAYYLNLDNKFFSLAAILKLWAKIQGLKGTKTLQSNTLNFLVIFYLQQKKIAPPFVLLQRHLTRCPIKDWETNFDEIHYKCTITDGLYQLLGGFFEYYSGFNFDEYVVSPLLGRPIRKTEFEDITSLPEELSLYKRYMSKPESRPFVFNTKLCVQDAIEQRRNTAFNVDNGKVNKFISLVKFAARMYRILPKDSYLRFLLTEHKEGIATLTNSSSIQD